MKALIWDLDGTLNDSYPRMVDALMKVCHDYHINEDKESIHRYITQYSIGAWLAKYEPDSQMMHAQFQHYLNESTIDVPLIDGVVEALQWGYTHNYQQFIYTHSPSTINKRLSELKIAHYFTDVVTIDDGFKPKPDPEAYLYLQKKYNIETAYYIGDRTLDMDFAYNSGIKGILYLPKDSYVIPNGHETLIVDSIAKIEMIETEIE